ncbi:Mycophenolic acid acyl-glucuronide esterase, mitochondrial [Nymphon striatum]|nr:Mycophenolic acid acyl-glucuronide esterase, mitochondrial [Nymphon striatum]
MITVHEESEKPNCIRTTNNETATMISGRTNGSMIAPMIGALNGNRYLVDARAAQIPKIVESLVVKDIRRGNMPDFLDTKSGRRLAYHKLEGRGPGVVFLGGFKSDMEGTKAIHLEAWAKTQGRAFLRVEPDRAVVERSASGALMQVFGKWLGRVLLLLLVVGAGLWFFAPREPVDTVISFDSNALGDNLDEYLSVSEGEFDDITEGVEKRIIWAGQKGEPTAISIVYIHGFSATSEEIRPVPDKLAALLGANLFYTRLKGHGRGGLAMTEPVAGDWLEDTAEALAIGRRLGEQVIVIATSTGGTAAAIAATDAALMQNVKGIAMISPNFRVRSPAAVVLEWPLVRSWAAIVAGAERSFAPHNEAHGKYWTTIYPTTALIPMSALVKYARDADYSKMEQRVSLITLGVADLERAAAFYEALGWKRTPSPDGVVAFDLISQTLGLYPLSGLADELGIEIGAIGGFSGITLAHNVRAKEEVSKILDAVEAAGGKVLKAAQDVFWGGHHGYFADLDGHVFEVAFNPFSPVREEDGAFQWNGYGEA